MEERQQAAQPRRGQDTEKLVGNRLKADVELDPAVSITSPESSRLKARP